MSSKFSHNEVGSAANHYSSSQTNLFNRDLKSQPSGSPNPAVQRHEQLDNSEIERFFEANGIRWTPQRQMVLDSFRSQGGHISAEEVHSQIKKVFPKVNLSTIYRTLEKLCELGVAVEIETQGDDRKRYELVGDVQHHHLICEQCRAEIELDSIIIEQIITTVRTQYGFRLKLPHFVGYGLCPGCAGKRTQN